MAIGDLTPAEGRRGVLVLKQSADIYTVLLILAFVFVSIGCLFLFLEMKSYEGLTTKVPGDARAPQAMWVPGQEIPAAPEILGHDKIQSIT